MKSWLRDKLSDILADLKRIHMSATQWFNGAVAFFALALPELIEFLPQMQQYIPAITYETWMKVLLVGNFLLRFKTKTSMANK